MNADERRWKAARIGFVFSVSLCFCGSLTLRAAEPAFEKKKLTDVFYCEGANAGDFNHDGKMDVVAGPYWYEGPDFQTKHEYYKAEAIDPLKYSQNFIAFTDDINHDGWTDILIVGFPGDKTKWFENPQGKDGLWPEHVAFDVTDDESPTYGDIDGDGQKELICANSGQMGYAKPDSSDPTKKWTWHGVTPKSHYQRFTHGLGIGDVNGDGRMDLLENTGWWEQTLLRGAALPFGFAWHFADAGAAIGFDAVVGNPPFLNQLETLTVRSGAGYTDVSAHAGPYTDTAWLFLLASIALARSHGRVVLVQPQSLLAARDAAGVRRAVTPHLEGMWSCDERIFAANVRVCAPVLGADSGTAARVRRWAGRDVRPVAPAARPTGATWSALLPTGVPTVTLSHEGGVLGDIADATAGFREQFYGLAPHVIDARDDTRPRLVTSGLVDVGRIAWGERTARFAGARYEHPRVDVAALPMRLRRWVADRLRPKVVLATQTKVLEAAVDAHGAWVPSTPVIAIEPHDVDDVWRVGAVLLAPPVSAWAASTFAGAALAANAIKLSAKQVCTAPLPGDQAAWHAGATALRDGDVESCAQQMNGAYEASDEVLAWWYGRR